MTDRNSMALAYFIASFFVCLTCVVFTFIQNRTDKLQKKLYVVMLFLLLSNIVAEIVSETVIPYRLINPAVPGVLWICKYIYFLTHSLMLPVLGYYVLAITGRLSRFTPVKHILFNLPMMIIIALLLTNPIHHWCYYFDNVHFDYHRNIGVTLLYITSAGYILFFVLTLFSSWKAITTKRRISMTYFVVMVLVGILIQMRFIMIRVELFAESVAFLGLLLTIEDEGDLIDNDVGIYNRKALRIDLDNLLINRATFHIICIKIENPDMIRRVTGSANTEILTMIMYKELVRYVPRYFIYQTSPDTFILTLKKESCDECKTITRQLSERFERSFDYNNSEIMLNATVMLAEMPRDIDNAEDVFIMADGNLPANHKKYLIGTDDLSFILRRRAVESAIQRGIKEKKFEVYYQPTYSADTLRVHGAEALCRLRDEKLGIIGPVEFIPIAEQLGVIGDIDDYVLSCVCDFLASGVPQKLGISIINVNLSVLQCIKPGFTEHIAQIVDESGAERKSIGFEITESVDANDYGVMKTVIRDFTDAGFIMYMDDYGTGYSNMQALFSMDFDVIKIDKSILWGAQKSELGMAILENNIRMLRELRLKILVEGVETKEQIELLQRLGVDYMQGFFFSKPVPVDEFISLLDR